MNATGTPAVPDATPLGEPVELTGPWPPDAPTGVLTLSSRQEGDLHIAHADPRVVFSAEVIGNVARGRTSPHVTLDRLNFTIPNGHVGALLKIRAANRQVIYRLTEWVPSIRAYVGEWPE